MVAILYFYRGNKEIKKSLNMTMKQKFEAIWWITNVKLQTQNIRRFDF